MNQTVNHEVHDAAAEPTASLANTTSEPCPPWCEGGETCRRDYEGMHMSTQASAPCLVKYREDGHLCGYTNCSDPAFNQNWCDLPNFAQIVWTDEHAATIEIGHGDDLLPAMTIEAAEQFAACLAELVLAARKAVRA
jgi:hypothetical protein